MHGADDHVAGVGGLKRGLEAFLVAHFADHDHVRRLAHGVREGAVERRAVQPDFALLHERLAVAELVFDRVLDRDDVLREMLVDVLDHRRQRGRFAAAGGAADQDDTARRLRDGAEHRRERKLFHGADLALHITQRDAVHAALLVRVDAETPQLLHAVGEVRVAVLLVFLQHAFVHDAVQERVEEFVRRDEVDGIERARDAEVGGSVLLEQDVRCAVFHALGEDLMEGFDDLRCHF